MLQGSKVWIFVTYYTIYRWSLKLFTRKWNEMKETDFKTNSDELTNVAEVALQNLLS